MKTNGLLKMVVLAGVFICSTVALHAQRASRLKQHDTLINSAVGSWALKSSQGFESSGDWTRLCGLCEAE